jgi:hypothetical protein
MRLVMTPSTRMAGRFGYTAGGSLLERRDVHVSPLDTACLRRLAGCPPVSLKGICMLTMTRKEKSDR